MEEIFVVLLVLITSTIAYRATGRSRAAGPGSLRVAIHALLDYVGAFAVFVIFNLSAGAIFILLIRGFTPYFVGLYQLKNPMLLVLSAAQGFVFQLWWRHD